jgi:hypothetical protein
MSFTDKLYKFSQEAHLMSVVPIFFSKKIRSQVTTNIDIYEKEAYQSKRRRRLKKLMETEVSSVFDMRYLEKLKHSQEKRK